MGLVLLVLGLIVFLAAQTFVTVRELRAAALARLGSAGYWTAFALAALAGLALIVFGFTLYRQAGPMPVWNPPDILRQVAIVLMWPAAVLAVAAYLPGRIQRRAKHPLLAAVKLWAFAHLLVNGDLGGMVLFGTFLAWGVYARFAVKRRERAGKDAAAAPPAGPWTNDLLAVVVGSVVYLALAFTFHPVVIGIPVFGS
jgi:uncharacterized membrane protein